ncbi:hypothetical protein BC829DRAFT_207248 [Chytridium lagenaria]|nr:hypothetical protein BC829DRAFT_207248 [Chytridium lagenaria]
MESTSTSATSKVMHLEAQVEDLRQRLESSLSSNGHLTKTIQELRENLRYVEDCLQGSTDTNNRRVREMEARLETAESESRRYDAKARDAERECEELRDSLRTVADDRGGQIQKLTQSMMHMREKISSLEDEVFDAMERAKAFEVASTSAREEAGSLRLALQKAEASRDLNEDQFKTLAAERTAVVEEYQKRASDLEARVKVLDGKLADAESQLMVQKEEAFKATKDVAEARKAFKEKSQALSQFQSETAEQIASKASTIETLRAKLHQAEEGVRFAQESEIKVKADKDKALATAKMEVQQLKDRIQSLEEDLKESRQSFDRLKERTDLEASDTSERMKELLARLSSPSAVKEVEWVETRVKFEREVATLRSELSVSQSGFKDLEKRGKELRDTYEQKLSHRAKEVQELQSTVKELEAKIRKSDDDKNLREEVKKIKDDYALIKNQLAESEDRKTGTPRESRRAETETSLFYKRNVYHFPQGF